MADKIDAITLLKDDHRKVEDLFAQFENTTATAKKKKLAAQICMELTVHTRIEEEIFYPACRGQVEDDLVNEAFVEHDGAKVLLAEIEAGNPDDEYFDAKITVLSEMIKHHVQEEEKRAQGLFAQAKKAGIDVDDLGRRLAARKSELLASYKKSGTPTPEMVTFSATRLMEAPRAA